MAFPFILFVSLVTISAYRAKVTAATTAPECTSAGQCPHPDYCLYCPNTTCSGGSTSVCASSSCVKGKCVVNPTTCPSRPTKCCTIASDCPHSNLCRVCTNKCGPQCARAKCVKNECKQIAPCSICTDK
ncbi:unnamed protein product [Didymodactylos carnosus]|uniref:Uncharacterized protein n=1 Tax=Didymodactylos carnosus TaxID=1234261 RepID=A0A8S2Q579_9BILA|nr:unnamed protein product [Didymodactylos carnosus]CAF4089034.1 unnamed protein product [Didymodactylos carnosus]